MSPPTPAPRTRQSIKARSPRPRPGARSRARARSGTRHLARVAVVAALAVGLASCSSQSDTEEDKARSTVESFLLACATDRTPAARELLTQLAQLRFAEGATTLSSCLHVVPLGVPADAPSPEDLDALKEAHVTHLSVEGGFATAEAEVAGRRVPLALEEIRGAWRVAPPTAGGH